MYLVHKLRSPFGGRGRSRRLDGTVALVKKVIPPMRTGMDEGGGGGQK